uniref:Methyltransferase type 11 domain-containing protein n=1 Tax=viral metagenome TaxID=1070528 RepID=A0A6C0LDE5_9ZZZZ
MHDTSLRSGKAFSEAYGFEKGLVVDLGGRNVNGSLRSFFEEKGMKYVCVDMESDPSVDIVIPPGEKLPFEDGSVDLIVSTSCFEHDPCFWLTFKEMTRIIKMTGYIYINAPTSGPYHCYPGDNWRFYSDAGQALAYWSGKQISNEPIYPVKVIETFNILGEVWNDFVCVWKRVDIEHLEKDILIRDEIINNVGLLEMTINNDGLQTRKKC